MLSLVLQRSQGLCAQREFAACFINGRARNLELSKYTDFENLHGSGINTLDFELSDERYLLCGAGNGTVIIYDLDSTGCRNGSRGTDASPKKALKTLCTIGRSNKFAHKFSVETVQWYPFDTGLFTTSSTDKSLKVWDANLLKPAETIHFPGIVYSHHMSSVASEHNLIAVGTDSAHVKLFDMRTGASAHTLSGHRKSVYVVKWSPRLPFSLATGSHDCRVMLWDIRMAKANLIALDQHNGDKAVNPESVSTAHNGHVVGLTFLDDGHHLLTYGADNRLRLWNAATAENTLTNYGKITNKIKRCLKFCVSTRTSEPVVYIPNNDAINTYDVFTGRRIQTLTGHFTQVMCCAYRPCLQEMYSGANDRNLLQWTPDFELENAYSESCASTSKRKNSVVEFHARIGSVRADHWSSDEGD